MKFSQNGSGMSISRLKGQTKYSMSAKIRSSRGSVGVSSHAFSVSQKNMAPKPEPLTDKQILRCLNAEFSKSKIFRDINFKKLPDRI